MVKIEFDNHNDEITKIIDSIEFDIGKKTIADFQMHYESNSINLNPVFQRASVWKLNQRKNLMKSIYENIPIPTIFLYKRYINDKPIFDVIDGKQRLESIFMFLGLKGFKKQKFPFKLIYNDNEDQTKEENAYWDELNEKVRRKILQFPINTITVSGNLGDISDIFVRINSTGSSLSRQEIRTAKYLQSSFLQRINKLANQKSILDYLQYNRIISPSMVKRQKHVEFISELVLSIHNEGPIDRKKAIERSMESGVLKASQLNKSIKEFNETLKLLKRIFPDIVSTRFNGLADFYTLFMLVWSWRYLNKNVLTNSKTYKLLNAYLIEFGNQCDRIKKSTDNYQIERVEGDQIYINYMMIVKSSTDSINQRRNREKILSQVFNYTFETKDPYRNFSKEQRRLLWNNSNKKCAICNKKLSFNNFHADHIKPYSKGGKTILSNAQVLCTEHNIKKADK